MSTKMDEDDWAHTLAVFRACLPRRGRKAEDDRRFLEALHFFTVENVRWRALPERFGHWNSVWKRFDRLSNAGVFEAFFDTLASMSSTAHLIEMFDSTLVRAHVSAAGAKGVPIPTKPPVYNGMIAPRDSWMMPPLYNEMIPPGA